MSEAIQRANALRERADNDLWNWSNLFYRVTLGAGIGALVGAVDPEESVAKRIRDGAIYGFAYHAVAGIYGVAIAKIAQRVASTR